MKYRDKITVERIKVAAVEDPLGGVDLDDADTWETYHEPYAWSVARGGSEFARFGIVNEEVTHVFDVRKGSETEAITAADRIMWGSRRFEIKAAYNPNAASQEIRIEATEIK
jgi:head-tail adaptor